MDPPEASASSTPPFQVEAIYQKARNMQALVVKTMGEFLET